MSSFVLSLSRRSKVTLNAALGATIKCAPIPIPTQPSPFVKPTPMYSHLIPLCNACPSQCHYRNITISNADQRSFSLIMSSSLCPVPVKLTSSVRPFGRQKNTRIYAFLATLGTDRIRNALSAPFISTISSLSYSPPKLTSIPHPIHQLRHNIILIHRRAIEMLPHR